MTCALLACTPHDALSALLLDTLAARRQTVCAPRPPAAAALSDAHARQIEPAVTTLAVLAFVGDAALPADDRDALVALLREHAALPPLAAALRALDDDR